MPAVGLLVGEMPAVFLPAQARLQPLVLEAVHLRLQLPARGDLEHIQFVGGELVARQGIGSSLKLRAAAALWGGLNQVNLFALARLDAEGGQRLRVWRPREPAVSMVLFAVA